MKSLQIVAALAVLVLASFTPIQQASALSLARQTRWFWASDTNAASSATGDIDLDGVPEIVTVGYYNDGTRWVALLTVWDSNTMTVKNVTPWIWGTDTQAMSVAIGVVDATGKPSIVTGGSFYVPGIGWLGQLIVWNGTTLAAKHETHWQWGTSTQITSVAVGNVNATGLPSIIAGGGFYALPWGWVGQYTVWNGTLAFKAVQNWAWGVGTVCKSVAVGVVDATGKPSIVTGGSFNDGVNQYAQMFVWNGTTGAVKHVQNWLWTSRSEVSAVALGIVDAAATASIVTGGSYFDGTRQISQLMVWNGTTMVPKNISNWYWTSDTRLATLAIGNVDSDPAIEIVSGGTYSDGANLNAQIVVWTGATLASKQSASWLYISKSRVNSVSLLGPGTATPAIASCGVYNDLTRDVAELRVWSP